MAINTTASTGLSATMQTYYDRKMIRDMAPRLLHYQYGQKCVLRRNEGNTVNFRKWTAFPAMTTPLSEGVVPDGQDMAMTAITAQVKQYGGYVAVSDLLDLTALDPVINDAVELMANQGALSIDRLTREELLKGAHVLYAGGRDARGEITAADRLTTTELRRAVRTLRKNCAPQFSRGSQSYYVAIVGPDAVFDLQSDPLWQDVSKYQAVEQIYSGEIGRLFGCIIVETPEAALLKGAGAGGADVAATLIFGKDAYGVVDIEGENVRSIIKCAGSAGTADPLEQNSTVGWKAAGFAAKILQEDWLLRVEHGITG